MIVAHLFLREEKKKQYMMCETTATDGLDAPYATPEHMFEVTPGDDPKEWEERVCKRILSERSDLEFEASSYGKKVRKNRPCSIDLIFRRKKKGLLSKLGIN